MKYLRQDFEKRT